MKRILIIDDQPELCSLLTEYLSQQGYYCASAWTAGQALQLLGQGSFDLILLDIMLPDLDGISLCRQIRKQCATPIIIISAKGEEEDRILGLDTGADDYLSKPFSVKELGARVRALLRRMGSTPETGISCGELQLFPLRHQAFIRSEPLRLTKKEEFLLAVLASHPGQVFTREQLMEDAWSYESDSNDRAIDTHIKRIRSKLEPYGEIGFRIKTIWGIGYTLEVMEK